MTTPKRGRPPYQPNPRKMQSFRLDPQIVEYLASVPNKTDAIEAAIRKSIDFRKWARGDSQDAKGS